MLVALSGRQKQIYQYTRNKITPLAWIVKLGLILPNQDNTDHQPVVKQFPAAKRRETVSLSVLVHQILK